jgi:hypothetical protein
MLPGIIEKRIFAVNSNQGKKSKSGSFISAAMPVDASALAEGLTVLYLPF